MPDSFTDQLDQLAPKVDMDASRSAFDRAIGRTPRQRSWLLPAAVVTLLIAGVVGLWALGRSSTAVAPVSPSDSTVEPTRPDGPIARGAGFEVIDVAETNTGFGLAALATDPDHFEDWMSVGPEVADIDFGRDVVLIMTRPDNACPDELTHFIAETPDSGIQVWTPQFEELASACDDPLLSWRYVVTLDRAALGRATTIRIPGDDVYGVAEQFIEFRRGDDAAPIVSATGVRVPVPNIGSPLLQNTTLGLVWVVRHQDDTVSVLRATIPRPVEEDSGVSMLEELVLAHVGGASFTTGSLAWDAHGRAINGGRSTDLGGYIGRLDGDEVEVFTIDPARLDGEPDGIGAEPATMVGADASLRAAGLEPMDLGTFLTLSSNGPIWRYLDATLVVENGVGRICETEGSLPVPPARCRPGGIILDTLVTSNDPSVTTWFASPILAFQDPFRGFTHVIPLGGSTSRNDAVPLDTMPEFDMTVLSTELVCRERVGLVLSVSFDFAEAGSAEFVVTDGEVELGSGVGAGGAGSMGISFSLSAAPSPQAQLHASSDGDEQVIPLTDLGTVDCAAATPSGFREVASVHTDLSFGEIYAVGSESALTALWDELQPGFDRPSTIDFRESVALIVTIPGGGCAQQLADFDLTDDAWLTPVFASPDDLQFCTYPLWSWTHVIAVDRRTLDEVQGFRLPADENYGYPDAEAPLESVADTTVFTVVDVERTQLRPGGIYAAGSEAEYTALWGDLEPGFDRPVAIEFAQSIAVIVMISGDPCVDELSGFEPTDDGWLTPIFETPANEQGCPDVAMAWTYVVAVARSSIGPDTKGFRLPSDPLSGSSPSDAPLPTSLG